MPVKSGEIMITLSRRIRSCCEGLGTRRAGHYELVNSKLKTDCSLTLLSLILVASVLPSCVLNTYSTPLCQPLQIAQRNQALEATCWTDSGSLIDVANRGGVLGPIAGDGVLALLDTFRMRRTTEGVTGRAVVTARNDLYGYHFWCEQVVDHKCQYKLQITLPSRLPMSETGEIGQQIILEVKKRYPNVQSVTVIMVAREANALLSEISLSVDNWTFEAITMTQYRD